MPNTTNTKRNPATRSRVSISARRLAARTKRRIAWGAMALLAFGFALFSARYFMFSEDVFPGFLRETYKATSPIIYVHVLPGVIAMLLGPLQFLGVLRRAKYRRTHRVLGRMYVASCLVAALGALWMATVAYGGLVTGLGLGALAVLWIGATSLGTRAALIGNIAVHRRWMTRSFAMTFAIVMFRVEFELLQVFGMPRVLAYQLSAWGCWIINLAVTERFILARATDGQAKLPVKRIDQPAAMVRVRPMS